MWPFGKKKEKPRVDRSFMEDFKYDVAELLIRKGLDREDAIEFSNQLMQCANKKVVEVVY